MSKDELEFQLNALRDRLEDLNYEINDLMDERCYLEQEISELEKAISEEVDNG